MKRRTIIPLWWVAGLGVACLAMGPMNMGPAVQPPPDQQAPPQEQAPPAGEPATGEQPPPAEDVETQREPVETDADSVRTARPPRPEDIIREFQKQRPQLVPVLPTGPEDETIQRATPEEAAQGPLRPARLPDGAMLVDRAGRVVREAEWWVFVFESDNSSYPEPPMKLLPNQALERMVRESRGGVDPVVFVVTAEVTDFKAENYLLPRKVLRQRDLGNLKK